jgi:hypothetical protein
MPAPLVLAASLRWGDAQIKSSSLAVGQACNGALGLDLEAFSSVSIECAAAGGAVILPAGLRAYHQPARDDGAAIVGPATVTLREDEVLIVRDADRDLELRIEAFRAERTTRRRRLAGAAMWSVAAAAALHALLLAASARASSMAPSLAVEADTRALRGYLAAAESHTRAPTPVVELNSGKGMGSRISNRDGEGHQAGGERHEEAVGKAGDTHARAKTARWSAPARAGEHASLKGAATEDMATIIASLKAAGTPTEVFGDRDGESDRHDKLSAEGQMAAFSVGDAEGAGGLGLSGAGEGGGGKGEGIGLGRVGTIGHLDGNAGEGTQGRGEKLRGHTARRWGHGWGDFTQVSGRLPPEAIKRVIQQNKGRVRACVEGAKNPGGVAYGRISVKFVIGLDGAVVAASKEESTIYEESVNRCIVRAMSGLAFPQPEGGTVTVIYPFVIEPFEAPDAPMTHDASRLRLGVLQQRTDVPSVAPMLAK